MSEAIFIVKLVLRIWMGLRLLNVMSSTNEFLYLRITPRWIVNSFVLLSLSL